MTLGCLKLPQARAELGLTLAALCCSSTEAKRSAAAAVAGPGAVPCRHALCPRVWLTAANPNVRGCCGAGFRLGQRCSTPAAARGPSAGTTRAATPHPVPRRSGSSRAGRARSLQAVPAGSPRALTARAAAFPWLGWAGRALNAAPAPAPSHRGARCGRQPRAGSAVPAPSAHLHLCSSKMQHSQRACALLPAAPP